MSRFSISFFQAKNKPPHLIYHINVYMEMCAKVVPSFYEFATDSYKTTYILPNKVEAAWPCG